jgi:L-histidine Nalpha-methyltransferase
MSLQPPLSDAARSLAEAVRVGLHQQPKRLPSRFFYDAEGSRLFAEIMRSPDYYLTRSEYEIIDTHKADLLPLLADDNRPFELVEFGAGDGLKTKLLLDFFQQQRATFTYVTYRLFSGSRSACRRIGSPPRDPVPWL